jgi:predicted nucleotidyltransferase
MAYDKIKILREVKNTLIRKFKNDIHKVILFGSQVAGEPNEYSDYDILVILNKKYDYKYENQVLDSVLEVVLKFNVLIDIHIISRDELLSLRGSQAIYQKALEIGIPG